MTLSLYEMKTLQRAVKNSKGICRQNRCLRNQGADILRRAAIGAETINFQLNARKRLTISQGFTFNLAFLRVFISSVHFSEVQSYAVEDMLTPNGRKQLRKAKIVKL